MSAGHRRAHWTEGAAPFGAVTDLLPEAELAELAGTLAAAVSAVDLASVLETLPPDVRREVLRPVGVRDARKVPAAAYSAALRMLVGGDPRRREHLRSVLAGLTLHAFGNPDDLDASDCVALLTEDGARHVLRHAPRLWGWATWKLPTSIRRWALATVLQQDRQLAVVALGLLAGDPGEPDAGRSEVLAAWKTLRCVHPELPEHPIGSARVSELGHLELKAAPPPESEPTMNTDGTDDTTGAEPPDLDALADELTRLRERFTSAAETADRIATRLRDGRRPEAADLGVIHDAVGAFDALHVRVASLGGDEPGTDLADLERRVEAASEVGRIRALAGLHGPESMAEEIEQIRAMCTGPDAARVAVLADLLEALRAHDDERALELAGRAHVELPERFGKVVIAATMRSLSVEPIEVPQPSVESASEQGQRHELEDEDKAGLEDESELEGMPESLSSSEVDGRFTDDLAELDEILREATSAKRRVSAEDDTTTDRAEPRDATSEVEADYRSPADPASLEPDTPGRFHDEEFERAEAAAIRAGRFGLAAYLREAAGRPEAECNARRCAALAVHMALFGQALAGEFTLAAGGLEPKAFAEDLGGAVLAWAAGIRTGLVCPTPESTQLVEHLNVFFTESPALHESAEAFVQAARSGAYLSPGVDGLIRGAAAAREERHATVREAERLLAEGPRGKIRFQFATTVFNALLKDDGVIGRLLVAVKNDDASRASEIGAAAVRLAAPSERDRVIAETEARLGRKKNTIIGPARKKLEERIATALDVVDEWVTAVRRHDEQAEDHRDHRLVSLRELRETLAALRDQAALELARFASDEGPVPQAAAVAAAALLSSAFDLLDGDPLPNNEPAVGQVLNRDLLLIPDLPLVPRTLAPVTRPDLERLVRVALAGDIDWTVAFQARADRLDHEATRDIVTLVAESDAALAAELRGRRDDLVVAARADRDQAIEGLRDQIALWRRDGVLTEDQARRMAEDLAPVTAERADFDRVRQGFAELRERAARQRSEAIEIERARLARIKGTLAASDARRVSVHIDQGDLTTAREFLAQLEDGRSLPQRPPEVDHFARFYPAFPRTFARRAAGGRRNRGQESSELLESLRDASKIGKEPVDTDLERLLNQAGISVTRMRKSNRDIALLGLRKWNAISQSGKRSFGNMGSSIAQILRMIGLEGDQEEIETTPERWWIDLRNVRSTQRSPLPAFGSGMSSSGDRLRLLLVWRQPDPRKLTDLLRGQAEGQTVLVLYFGVLSDEDRVELARAARRHTGTRRQTADHWPVAGVLDDAAIAYLACHPDDWSVAVALMAPFTATNPYISASDVSLVPDEMFYGRRMQLDKVIDRRGPSFVYGGRQLGKSALLRKAEREIRAQDPDRTVILETIQHIGRDPASSLWPRLGERLSKAGILLRGLTTRDQVIEGMRTWSLENLDRQLLILLDEADDFLDRDAAQGRFQDVGALRDLMNDTDRRIKVVWAGLHQTVRFHRLPNQPLPHLGGQIAIGPLDPQDAFDLLVKPFGTLGFTFPDELAARVIAEANNAPALVQLFAEKLLTRLRGTPGTLAELPYTITREDVVAVWRDSKLQRDFRDRFEWTLNLDNRYKVIAYTVALHALSFGASATLSVAELRDECQGYWEAGFADCAGDTFRLLLEECVNLGVLGVEGDRYRLRTPYILDLLGGVREVEAVLLNDDDLELPDAFDAHSYRALYHGGPERSPFSSAQLSRMLRPTPLVHVVAGSPALQIERVVAALQDGVNDREGLWLWPLRAGERTLRGALKRAALQDGQHVLIIDKVGCADAGPFERSLEEVRQEVTDEIRDRLSVVVVAGPGLASSWVRVSRRDDVELVGLRRFGPAAIRQWMLEQSQGFPDKPGQELLLETTGGWPLLVGKVVTWFAEAADRDRALDRCRIWLEENPRSLLEATGVLADPCLAAAWRTLVEFDSPDEPDALADWLAMQDPERGLGASDLTARGYLGPADLVEALRVLGVLTSDGTRLAVEPVLAAATRRAGATG